jgi:trafficking protein particle complex subunit 12
MATTPSKSAIKKLPGKIAKKLKHQFRRLDGVLHHVIHPRVKTPTFSVTSPSSPIFYPIGVARAFLPPDQSTGSVHTCDVKCPTEVDSTEPSDSLANHSIDLSMSVADSSTTHIDMSDDLHFPQEEPQLNLHEQDTSLSDSMVTSPIEPETPDPFLIDDEEEDSEEEEKASSDANSSQVVSPTQAIPLDLPSSPEVSISQPQAPLPNLQKDVPLPPSESEEEYVPDLYIPTLIVPTMFLPIPNVRRSFSSNLLTWWLVRNSMYDNYTRPIR